MKGGKCYVHEIMEKTTMYRNEKRTGIQDPYS